MEEARTRLGEVTRDIAKYQQMLKDLITQVTSLPPSLSPSLPACLLGCLLARLPACLPLCLSVCLSVHPCLSVCLSICLPACLPSFPAHTYLPTSLGQPLQSLINAPLNLKCSCDCHPSHSHMYSTCSKSLSHPQLLSVFTCLLACLAGGVVSCSAHQIVPFPRVFSSYWRKRSPSDAVSRTRGW